ncbi:MAG: hypothetical protein ABIH11_00445 [Candidatus Altiarchaeota archaeon]
MDEKRMALFAVLAGTVVRIIFWATTPVTGDACFHYNVARFMSENLSIPSFEYVTGGNPFWYPPLFHIITAVLYRLTGILTLTPLVFGIGGLVAFKKFCDRFYPEHSLKSVLLLSFLPFHVYYSGIGYLESLIFLTTVLSYHYYYAYLKDGGNKQLGYAAITSALTALTHYHGMIIPLSITAHLALRDRKKAAVFLAAALLIASPWYVRNYMVYGNPVWPKLYGGKYPGYRDVQGISVESAVASIFSPGRWVSVFFDFWIGAPNSGEDFWNNVEVGAGRYPFFMWIMVFWLTAIIALSILSFRGFMRVSERRDQEMIAIVFALSLIPFTLNGLARMFIAVIPFLVIAVSKGVGGISNRGMMLATPAVILLLVGGSYGYAQTYKNLVEGYEPFFEKIREEMPEGSRIVMPFMIHECIYYTGMHCLKIGGAGSLPEFDTKDMRQIFKDYDVEYVCCNRMHWSALPEQYKSVCRRLNKEKSYVSYSEGDSWGKCWNTMSKKR